MECKLCGELWRKLSYTKLGNTHVAIREAVVAGQPGIPTRSRGRKVTVVRRICRNLSTTHIR